MILYWLGRSNAEVRSRTPRPLPLAKFEALFA
jgi:hypothetical protein